MLKRIVVILLIGMFLSVSLPMSIADITKVNDDGTADYTSIQEDIDASTIRETIFVYAEEYCKSLNIDYGIRSDNNEDNNKQINNRYEITIIGQCSGGSVFDEPLGQYVTNLSSINIHFSPVLKSLLYELLFSYNLVNLHPNEMYNNFKCVSFTIDGKKTLYPHSSITLEDFSGYLTYGLWWSTRYNHPLLHLFIPIIMKGTCKEYNVHICDYPKVPVFW